MGWAAGRGQGGGGLGQDGLGGGNGGGGGRMGSVWPEKKRQQVRAVGSNVWTLSHAVVAVTFCNTGNPLVRECLSVWSLCFPPGVADDVVETVMVSCSKLSFLSHVTKRITDATPRS